MLKTCKHDEISNTIYKWDSAILIRSIIIKGFPGGIVVKNTLANVGNIRDAGSITGSGRFLEEDMANYSNLLA